MAEENQPAQPSQAPTERSPYEIPIDVPLYGAPEEQLEPPQESEPVSWTASEFIAHEKNAMWYMNLAGITLLLALLIFLITRDIISVVVMILGAIVFGFYGARQPRQLAYQADHSAIQVGQKAYPYNEFRSFSIEQEDAVSSVVFMPLKRFAPALTIYYPPEVEEQLVDLLASELPNEPPRQDLIDRLMKRIRF